MALYGACGVLRPQSCNASVSPSVALPCWGTGSHLDRVPRCRERTSPAWSGAVSLLLAPVPDPA